MQAIHNCFLITSCSLIPLTGTHVETLRQMRLLRDGKVFRTAKNSEGQQQKHLDVLNLMLLGSLDVNDNNEEKKKTEPLPKIQDLRIACEDKFLVLCYFIFYAMGKIG